MEADKREEPRGCDTDYPRVGATGTVYRRGFGIDGKGHR